MVREALAHREHSIKPERPKRVTRGLYRGRNGVMGVSQGFISLIRVIKYKLLRLSLYVHEELIQPIRLPPMPLIGLI